MVGVNSDNDSAFSSQSVFDYSKGRSRYAGDGGFSSRDLRRTRTNLYEEQRLPNVGGRLDFHENAARRQHAGHLDDCGHWWALGEKQLAHPAV